MRKISVKTSSKEFFHTCRIATNQSQPILTIEFRFTRLKISYSRNTRVLIWSTISFIICRIITYTYILSSCIRLIDYQRTGQCWSARNAITRITKITVTFTFHSIPYLIWTTGTILCCCIPLKISKT